MKTLLPVLVLALCLGGCSSPSSPPAAGGPLAILKGDRPGAPDQDFMGDEIRCEMQSIDGESVGDSYGLTPGKTHTLIAHVFPDGKQCVAVIRLHIPQAKTYRIRARRNDDAVTLTLMEEGGRLAATSTAPLADQMKFDVFVIQK